MKEDYIFQWANDGKVGNRVKFSELFADKDTLLLYSFMFGPDYTAGCPACSAIADGFNGFTVHLANHEKPVLSDGHIRRSAP